MFEKIIVSLLSLGAVASVFLVGLLGFNQDVPRATGSQGGVETYACTSYSINRVTVGNQASTVIVPASGRRAFALISQPVNATNTVSLALASGTAATIGTGFQLTPATTTSPVVSLSVGLSTDLPYTGDVTAISSTGSSTLLVTECRY